MKFKQKLALLRRSTVVKTIAGETFTFYPISIPMLFELKSSMKPLMTALKAMFAKQQSSGDSTQTVEETRDPMVLDEKGRPGVVVSRVTHIGAPDPELVKFRAAQEEKTFGEAVEAVFGDENRMLLGRVLADSLRDLEIRTDEEIDAFITDPAFDLPLLIEFLGGFFEVNAKVFGPFAGRVRELVKSRMSALTPNLDRDAASEPGSPEAPPESAQPTE